MARTSNHLKEIVESTNAIFDVLKNIANAYLTDNAEEALYNVHEYVDLVKTLKESNVATLLEKYKAPFSSYSSPNPYRPDVVALLRAQYACVKTLKKYTTINHDNILLQAEAFLTPMIIKSIKSDDIDLALLDDADTLDDFFETLKGLFRVELIRQINQRSQKITPSAVPTKEDVNFAEKSRYETVYDSDLDEEVEVIEISAEPFTPKPCFRPLSPQSSRYGIATPLINGNSTTFFDRRTPYSEKTSSDNEEHPCFRTGLSLDKS